MSGQYLCSLGENINLEKTKVQIDKLLQIKEYGNKSATGGSLGKSLPFVTEA